MHPVFGFVLLLIGLRAFDKFKAAQKLVFEIGGVPSFSVYGDYVKIQMPVRVVNGTDENLTVERITGNIFIDDGFLSAVNVPLGFVAPAKDSKVFIVVIDAPVNAAIDFALRALLQGTKGRKMRFTGSVKYGLITFPLNLNFAL